MASKQATQTGRHPQPATEGEAPNWPKPFQPGTRTATQTMHILATGNGCCEKVEKRVTEDMVELGDEARSSCARNSRVRREQVQVLGNWLPANAFLGQG